MSGVICEECYNQIYDFLKYLKGSFTLLVLGGRSGGSSVAESSITVAVGSAGRVGDTRGDWVTTKGDWVATRGDFVGAKSDFVGVTRGDCVDVIKGDCVDAIRGVTTAAAGDC